MEGGPTHHHAHRGGQQGTGSRGPRGIQLPPSPQPGHKASLPSRALTPLVVYYLRKGPAFGRVRIYLSLVSKQTLSSQGRTGAAPVPSSWPFRQQLSCFYDQDNSLLGGPICFQCWNHHTKRRHTRSLLVRVACFLKAAHWICDYSSPSPMTQCC